MKKIKPRAQKVKMEADSDFIVSFLSDKKNTAISNILTIIETKISGEDFKKVRKVVLDNINELFRLCKIAIDGEMVLIIEEEENVGNMAK